MAFYPNKPPSGNAFGAQPTFDPNTLPGAKNAFGAQPTFDPNTLPGAEHSPQGVGANPNSYTDAGAFGQPNLGSDPKMGKRPETPEAPLAGPGYEEDWYKKYGSDLMTDPSASERLFDMGVAGSNPYYDFAQQQAIKAINDSAAARGGFNSSYTQNLIGKTVADIRGQQAHELNTLAGQSDAGRFGRYDRGNEYASGAQRAMENRARGGLEAESDLAGGQSRLVGGFYGEAGREVTMTQMAQIEAALKAAGLTSAEAKAMMDQATDLAGLWASLYGGGKGKGSGGSSGGAGPTLYV